MKVILGNVDFWGTGWEFSSVSVQESRSLQRFEPIAIATLPF